MMIYFPAETVELGGSATEYTRIADSGGLVTHGFCPICGTPFWLRTDKHPGGIGIAVGAIDGSQSTAPVRSVFEDYRHPWITIPDNTQRYERGRDSRPHDT